MSIEEKVIGTAIMATIVAYKLEGEELGLFLQKLELEEALYCASVMMEKPTEEFIEKQGFQIAKLMPKYSALAREIKGVQMSPKQMVVNLAFVTAISLSSIENKDIAKARKILSEEELELVTTCFEPASSFVHLMSNEEKFDALKLTKEYTEKLELEKKIWELQTQD